MNNILFKSLKTAAVLAVVFFLSSSVALAAATYEYYPNGRIKSITYNPAENGVSYVEYLDEDYLWQGYGRLKKKLLPTADEDGAISYEYSYTEENIIAVASLNAGSKKDFVIDFKGNGFYKYIDDSSWLQMGSWSPESVIVTDLDKNGVDDLVVDYGTNGLYKYMNNSSFVQMGSWDPVSMVVADLDSNGTDDIVINYGTNGLYKYMNNSGFVQMGSWSPQSVNAADLDGDGKDDDLIIDYGPNGLYKYTNNGTFTPAW